jgi:hypothetical protein
MHLYFSSPAATSRRSRPLKARRDFLVRLMRQSRRQQPPHRLRLRGHRVAHATLSFRSPLATIRSKPSGKGHCSRVASAHGATSDRRLDKAPKL